MSQNRRPSTLPEKGGDDAETFFENANLSTMDTPETLYQTKQVGDVLGQAMADLPDELRTAIVMREIEGLSYDEIAQAMNCPIGTVRSRIFRAREAIAVKLKPLLEPTGGKRW